MPLPNEHAARQHEPGDYTKFRRVNNGGAGVAFIYGIKNGKSEVQSVRFDKDKFTLEQAKKWLAEHKYNTNVIPATGEHSGPCASEITVPVANNDMSVRYTLDPEDDDEDDKEYSEYAKDAEPSDILGFAPDGTLTVEAFRTGTHTDSSGDVQSWGAKDIQEIADKGNAQLKEKPVPVVIGHPDDTAPAYGWVENFWVVGDRVLAKLGQLNEKFTEALKAGSYKGRSISLYADNKVRHIGFLGGAQPAIEGLRPLTYSETTDCKTYEFGEEPLMEYTTKDVNFLFKLLKKFGVDVQAAAAKKEINMAEVSGIDMSIKDAEAGGQVETSLSVNDAELKDKEVKDPGPEAVAKIEIAKAKNVENEEQTENAELKSTIAQLISRIETLEGALAKDHSEASDKVKELEAKIVKAEEQSIVDFVESLVKDGKLRPADVEMTLMALNAQVELDKAPIYNMSETKEVKAPRVQIYKEKLLAMPKIVQFGEFPSLPAAQEGVSFPAPDGETVGKYIEERVGKKMAEQDKLGLTTKTSYWDALKTEMAACVWALAGFE